MSIFVVGQTQVGGLAQLAGTPAATTPTVTDDGSATDAITSGHAAIRNVTDDGSATDASAVTIKLNIFTVGLSQVGGTDTLGGSTFGSRQVTDNGAADDTITAPLPTIHVTDQASGIDAETPIGFPFIVGASQTGSTDLIGGPQVTTTVEVITTLNLTITDNGHATDIYGYFWPVYDTGSGHDTASPPATPAKDRFGWGRFGDGFFGHGPLVPSASTGAFTVAISLVGGTHQIGGYPTPQPGLRERAHTTETITLPIVQQVVTDNGHADDAILTGELIAVDDDGHADDTAIYGTFISILENGHATDTATATGNRVYHLQLGLVLA